MVKKLSSLSVLLAFSVLAFTLSSTTAVAQDGNSVALYQVVNVSNEDVLNMRSAPGGNQPIVAVIPHNGRTIVKTGGRAAIGRNNWVEVIWLGQSGWVNERFLSGTGATTQRPAPQPVMRNTTRPPAQAPAQRTRMNSANAHTHPPNRCTRTITHSHLNGRNPHQHNYQCQPGQGQSATQVQSRPKFRPQPKYTQYN